MKKNICLLIIALISLGINAQTISWKYTTLEKPWKEGSSLSFKSSTEKSDVTIYADQKLQPIEGFGASFNEIGWDALLTLKEDARNKILKDLFSSEGVNFTICRMPLGSSDYSLSYYSYNDVPEDFEMKNFNISRDRYIIIPYIKAAMKINPNLTIWASPWVPPVWMKVNNHYAMGARTIYKRMLPEKTISNDATAFKMENRYLDAYSLYFSKFVQAYKKEGIDISMVMVQNEPKYQPHWQSCTWRAEDISYFIGKHLGPRFEKDSLDTEIWLGTINTADPNYVRKIVDTISTSKYIKGIGFQWNGKKSIGAIHKEYPNYSLMQTESECGIGENNWESAEYTWSLINQYMSNGANSYMYWNMVLDTSGASTWGFKQNMMISINKETGEVIYNPEYYLMKHLSHYVLPGAFRLKTSGGTDHLAFVNPNGEIVYMYVNTDKNKKTVSLSINKKQLQFSAKGKSINTFVWKGE